jgi:beta-glucosidase
LTSYLENLLGTLTADKAKEFIGRFGFEALLGDYPDMLMAMMRYMPLRAMIGFGQGKYSEDMLADDLKNLNAIMEEKISVK